MARYGQNLQGRIFALWGLAFKPNTDDMRAAPSRVIVAELVRRGARVQANDPVAMDEARRCLALDLSAKDLRAVTLHEQPLQALQGADALVIATEWKAYRSPDFAAIKTALREPVIFDGRNLYEPAEVREAGLHYEGIGRRA